MNDHAGVPAHLVRDFDYFVDSSVLISPFDAFDRTAEQGRILYSRVAGGFWYLTRYEDIREVLHNPQLFSSHPVGIPAAGGWPGRLIPEELDPPEHAKYRQLLASAFSRSAAEGVTDVIRGECLSLLAELPDCFDFIESFARPLPTTVFTHLMGLPAERAGDFVRWIYQLIHSHDTTMRAQAAESVTSYLKETISERRASGEREGLINSLLHSQVDGRRLADEEALDICFLLFMAGLDTVTAALGFSIHHLAQHSEDQERLRGQPGVIAAAVEELLRCYSFVNAGRTATRDVDFRGIHFRAGDRILVSTCFADRDGSVFASPSTVLFERMPNRHIAFGSGIHRCLGSHLARKEMAVALEEFHRRIPHYRLADRPSPPIHGGGTLGLGELWLEIG